MQYTKSRSRKFDEGSITVHVGELEDIDMSAKRFHVARPDQLQTLVKFAKNNGPTIARAARIWRIVKDRKGETR